MNNAIPINLVVPPVEGETFEQHIARAAKHIEDNPWLWNPPTAAEEPKTQLERWMIFECFTEHYGERTRHLVGSEHPYGSGRVCSKIMKTELGPEDTLLFTTHSGRIYELVGHPGHSRDGLYVWGAWTNRMKASDIVEVTDQYWDRETDKAKLPV